MSAVFKVGVIICSRSGQVLVVTKLNTGCFQVNGENPVLQGSFSWPYIPSRKTGILMIKTCGGINRNHYYYSDTGGITGIFSDNCNHCFLVPSSLIYLTFIRNCKSVPIIPPPPTPSTSHLETQRALNQEVKFITDSSFYFAFFFGHNNRYL